MEETNNQDDTMGINNGVDNVDEENSDIEEEDSDDEEFELDDKVYQRLMKNDPTITNLNIDLDEDECYFSSIDWKKDGDCIANNNHLKIIRICGLNILREQNNELPRHRQQLQEFFSCIYRSSSIKSLSLSLSYSTHIVDEFGGSLIEGLCGHPSLERLEIEHACGRIGNIAYSALEKILKHSASKLKDLCIRNGQLDDEGMRILCNSLLQNSTLKRFCLCGNRVITSVGWGTLSNVIRHPNCKLIRLSLQQTSMEDEAVNILGIALRGSSVKALDLSANKLINRTKWQTLINQLAQTSVESLELNNNRIDDDGLASLVSIGTLKSLNLSRNFAISPSGWQTFFNSLQTRGIQLKKLDISCNKVGDEGVVALGSLLSTSSETLRTLNMQSCIMLTRLTNHGRVDYSISSRGWISLFTSLHGSNFDLVKLFLGNNNIDDEGMQLLVPLVSSMSSLKELNLESNQQVTPAGWQALDAYLQSPNANFALKDLSLGENNIDDDTVIDFTTALVNNKTLHGLYLYGCTDGYGNETINERGWKAVSSLLCNKASILDTYNSNHTLHNLDCHPSYSSLNEDLKLPDDLISYLDLNENKDKVEVARQKILQTHFSDDTTSKIQELLDMELEMIPAAIAWIGRPLPISYWKGAQVSGLSTMYNLTRRLPDLFDSSPQKKPSTTKRKRGV